MTSTTDCGVLGGLHVSWVDSGVMVTIIGVAKSKVASGASGLPGGDACPATSTLKKAVRAQPGAVTM